MPDTFQLILIGGVTGITSAVLTQFSTRAKIQLNLAAEYDKKLPEIRMEKYLEL
jgi:hypothetical protein